jgi:hypothetical protein
MTPPVSPGPTPRTAEPAGSGWALARQGKAMITWIYQGTKETQPARILSAGHAFVQNLRCGHYELAIDIPARHQLRTVFDQLAAAM